jgi:hypothetical protein
MLKDGADRLAELGSVRLARLTNLEAFPLERLSEQATL